MNNNLVKNNTISHPVVSRRKFLTIGALTLLYRERIWGQEVTDKGQAFFKEVFGIEDPRLQKQISELIFTVNAVRDTQRARNKFFAGFTFLEVPFDEHPREKAVIQSGVDLEFGDGFVYHGGGDLLGDMQRGHTQGETYFTRVPHEWAVGNFHNQSRCPVIYQMKTATFNSMMQSGQAKLFKQKSPNGDFIEPYPKAHQGFSLDKAEEIWVSEETYREFQELLRAEETHIPEKLQKYMPCIRDIIQLMGSGKIQPIPGLAHSKLKYSTPEERYRAQGEACILVTTMMMSKDLFNEIPFFQPQGKAGYFTDIDRAELIRARLAQFGCSKSDLLPPVQQMNWGLKGILSLGVVGAATGLVIQFMKRRKLALIEEERRVKNAAVLEKRKQKKRKKEGI